MRSSTSQTLELLLLQDPQQLGLQRQRHISDFVQEQSPTVSHFKAADFLRKGPGKRAFFVAEEFAFQQVKWNRRAIELYERSSAALAGVMDVPGDQLLARTRLSKNQDRGISWRNDFHKLQRLFEGKAGAHHFYSQRTHPLSYIRHSRVRVPYRYFLHGPLSLARVHSFRPGASNHKCKHSPARHLLFSSVQLEYHVVFRPPFSGPRAERIHWSNCSSVKGFARKATAPACMARR